MKRRFVILAAALAAAAALCVAVIGDPVVLWHNRQLRSTILELDARETTLEALVPFEWDAAYSFEAYTPREQIEEIIGFQSSAIRETVSEGMVQLLFTKGKRVTASVCGYAQSLGYRADIGGVVRCGDSTVLAVEQSEGIVRLTREE